MASSVESENILRDRVKSVTNNRTFKESQEGYDKWAETYEKDLLDCGYSAHLAVTEQICKLFPKETRSSIRILDVGAGTGLAAKELRKQGFTNIDCLEPNEAMLNKAREINLYGKYYQTYITGEPSDIPADTYDAITGSGIFGEGGHVPCEAIIEMIRLVKPGGYIALSTRHILVQQSEKYKLLEPLMERLEAEGKWKKESREIWPRFYLDNDGIVWCYKVL